MRTRTARLTSALIFLIVAAPAARGQGQGQPPQDNPPQPSAGPAYAQDTPEAAFKSFFLAMALGDEMAMKRLTVPVEGFEWLLKGDRVPPERAEEFRKLVMESMMLTRLKAGDEVKLPNGRVVRIAPEQVTEDRAVLMMKGGPIPTDLHRVAGTWRVDPRPVIAGRKAADAARRQAEAKAQEVK